MQRCTAREGISVQEVDAAEPGRKLFAIVDEEQQERALLVVRRVNDDLLPGPAARQVVRFSERKHSPHLSDEIWVSTLEHYRKAENLEAGQRDPMEGRLRLDVTPFFARRLSEAGLLPYSTSFSARADFSAEAEFASMRDSWVYCTAFCPSNERDAYRLGRRISSANDTITSILDVNAFALELGVDFAVALDESIHTTDDSVVSLIERAQLAHSEFRTAIRVDHGPVGYEDMSGTLDTGREPVELASRSGFVKPKSFSYQSEYRFALSTIGEPSVKTLHIPVSDALRECTALR